MDLEYAAMVASSRLAERFVQTFIDDNRWQMFLKGFGTTLYITLGAAVIGILIGVAVAVAKVYCHQSGRMKPLNLLLDVYLTVIRGTPTLVQLLIMYFIVFKSISRGEVIAILAFGINSGAYVAEIVRGGILAVDKGQTEAGRSLGLSPWTTMQTIVLPQAVKNILPALGNELITLLKETSIVGYIAITDLTKVAVNVQGRTYDAFFPLISIAIVYLVTVMGLSAIQRKVERRMARSDRR